MNWLACLTAVLAMTLQASSPVTEQRPDPYWRMARVVGVVDGDTFDLLVQQNWGGQPVLEGHRVRLLDADTPETRGPERPDGLRAKAEAVSWFDRCQPKNDADWPIDIWSRDRGNFGRPLAIIRCRGSAEGLGEYLLRVGWARPYGQEWIGPPDPESA